MDNLKKDIRDFVIIFCSFIDNLKMKNVRDFKCVRYRF